MPYHISPHAYLDRAKQRLRDGTAESLFYAAFEIRCCVESRQECYADAIEHMRIEIRSWKHKETARRLEKVFDSEKIAHLKFRLSDNKTFDLYYTPVTTSLSTNMGKMGDILHCMKAFKEDNDVYWQKTRAFVESVYKEAWVACHGTLLIPPLYDNKSGKPSTMVKIERFTDDMKEWITQAQRESTQIAVEVNYLDSPPAEWMCDL
jgi:hypothetical protein